MKIPLTKPVFGEQEEEAVCATLRSGWVVQGPNVEAFERSVAEYLDMPYAVAVSSCTTALHLALILAGVTVTDAVVVPAFTHPASAHAVKYVGANPMFVDIDPHTFNIDVLAIEQAIRTDRVKAIMVVHLFGLCADMDPILEIARKYGLFVIEDAACGLGSVYNGRAAGTMGHVSCFSFHPRKIITTGEGGMLVTNSETYADMARSLRAFGSSTAAYDRHLGDVFPIQDFDLLGYNYRMTDIQGALGVVQMQKLDDAIQGRQTIAELYTEAFEDIEGLRPPCEPERFEHSYQSYVLWVTDESPVSRDQLARRLLARGVSCRPGGCSVPTRSYYRINYGYSAATFPMASAAEAQSLTIPLFPQMSENEWTYVIETVRSAARAGSAERRIV